MRPLSARATGPGPAPSRAAAAARRQQRLLAALLEEARVPLGRSRPRARRRPGTGRTPTRPPCRALHAPSPAGRSTAPGRGPRGRCPADPSRAGAVRSSGTLPARPCPSGVPARNRQTHRGGRPHGRIGQEDRAPARVRSVRRQQSAARHLDRPAVGRPGRRLPAPHRRRRTARRRARQVGRVPVGRADACWTVLRPRVTVEAPLPIGGRSVVAGRAWRWAGSWNSGRVRCCR